MKRPWFVVAAIASLLVGCATEPRSIPVSTPNLLVRNDGLAPLQVGGWPSKFTVPCPSPGCFMGFATVNPLSARCIAFPDSLFLRLIRVDTASADTTIMTWKADEPIWLIARTSDQSLYAANAVVPATSLGWRISGPRGWEAGPDPSGSCSP